MGPLARIMGVPLSAADRDAAFTTIVDGMAPEAALVFFRDGAQHNTAKSGGLLAAQAIFLVVDTFALDHGWPRPLVAASMLIVLAGALLVMANLRGTMHPLTQSPTGSSARARASFDLVLRRSLRFNIALYLTYVSIILLAIAALTFLK
jgi:hypothetical protein